MHLATDFAVETCCRKDCNVTFALLRRHQDQLVQSHDLFYCPNGHSQHYTGASDAEKLRAARARETALQDQLAAAIREGEETRVALLRDRQRFANGVCPCCNRSFENVRRHMSTQHPDYDVAKVKPTAYRCSCGSSFGSLRGLRIHQGRVRRDGWDQPKTSRWAAHLTRV